jgi:transcriptional regulator with XRE-family HTH domain
MIRHMPTRRNLIDEARRRGARLAREIGDDLRQARLRNGLSLRQVAEAIGASRWQVGRRERGIAATAGLVDLVVHAAAVGLDLSVRSFAAAPAVRDAAQVRVLARFLNMTGSAWAVQLEAPLRVLRDQRAFDCLLRCGEHVVAVEVITRLHDLQAQLRPLFAKARDAGIERLIIVVADTRANREALELASDVLSSAFSLDARGTFAALRHGTVPARDAIVRV